MKERYNIGLIGDPVYHSKSPNIYAKLFAEQGCNGSFSLISVKHNELSDIKNVVNSYKLDAFAVTMPHKQSIIKYIDSMSAEADFLQSVNLVVCNDGRFVGYSTDGAGFVLALERENIEVDGKNIFVYGYGGAAAAVAFALKQKGAQVTVGGRNGAKCTEFADRLGISVKNDMNLKNIDVFVNGTPLGMTGHVNFADFSFLGTARKTCVVCDMVYKPTKTALLCAAEFYGMKNQNGMSMLLNQARVAFEIIRAGNV